ncbi:ubiquitin fusion degradation protein UFD1-domain-containing protein [Lasiosphaeria ovina]|uniref:Ubiquitin fusion degradation protein UFD1-domain-containing protein n=1 Tax=Lasiosphaeria ovina TaxID=92902 RepID=A0AAE0N9N3_9PEZI|nr:ubiquitin fusion degradation protein UFD1-domain-containing protein [Lasiosphaeria ovina]
MADQPAQPQLKWSASVRVAHPSRVAHKDLQGDKILLPQSALEQLLAASTTTDPSASHTFTAFDPFNPYSVADARRERARYQEPSQQLPHPLMFQLINQSNGNTVFAGIREFSAAEGEVALSPYLLDALGIQEKDIKDIPPPDDGLVDLTDDVVDLTNDDSTGELRITVKARQLPKGTYVRLRPLEAGYNPDDWKSLLERQLRASFTTLTKDSTLSVRGVQGEEFRFLVDKFQPEGDGICVVDTDLEVDIEALDEEQARETLRQIAAKAQRAPGTAAASSVGHAIDAWKDVDGQVLQGDYVDYELPSWDKSRAVAIQLSILDDQEVDLFVTTKSSRHRALPRDSSHLFADFSSPTDGVKRIVIQPTNVELEGAESLLISVHGFARPGDDAAASAPCRYTLRAKAVDIQGSQSVPISLDTEPPRSTDEEQCRNCLQWIPKRTMVLHENFCLRNNILCPQCKEGDPLDPSSEAETALSGLTAHERADGARTTDCHLCGSIVRLRDMSAHTANHELDKVSRTKPELCRGELCGRTLHGIGPRGQINGGTRMGQGPGNDLGLCSLCFAPLYASMHDPEGKALRRRIERRYLTQLMTGCGKKWCLNEWCKTGRANRDLERLGTSAAAALPLVKPLLEVIRDYHQPMHFCVDEASQRRKKTAEMLAAEGVWSIEWCIAALEAEGSDLTKARSWLMDWAPTKATK